MYQRALLSVYDKNGIVDFAKALIELGFDLFSSGGTAKTLKDAGVRVTEISALTGSGAILGHRVVTLHPKIHGGLLARDTIEDETELERHGIPRFHLACVDLYPLEAEIARPGSTRESVLELTDIGGPTILRSAAKGRRIAICDPADRQKVLDWLRAGRPNAEAFINFLAAKAEFVVASYCLASARYHSEGEFEGIVGRRAIVCAYGENKAQKLAALYSGGANDPLALDRFELVQGMPPSYNNFCDLERMLQTMSHVAAAFKLNRGVVPAIAIAVKHGNPCGAAPDSSLYLGAGDDSRAVAVLRATVGDGRAIFGGLVMTNFTVTPTLAEGFLTAGMTSGRRVLDGVVAPDFAEGVAELLKRKGDKCRMLKNPALVDPTLDQAPRFRYVRGGFLRQPNYTYVLDLKDSRLERFGLPLTTGEEDNLLLAWAVGATSNSNTITLVKDSMVIGNGVGQQDRVSCCELARKRARDAGHNPRGAVAYSDSFFPFSDGPIVLAEAGVTAILTSSGSVKDNEVKKCCVDRGVRLLMIPDAVGRGFYGH